MKRRTLGPSPPKRPWWTRLLLSFGAGLASALLVAIMIAVVDLYFTGHQLPALSAPLIDWSSMGVHLSLADILFLVAAVFATAITWHRTAKKGP
jgi:hypothetical protein